MVIAWYGVDRGEPERASRVLDLSQRLSFHLHQLNEVAAGIIEHGHQHRPGIHRLDGESHAQALQSFELGAQIIDLE